MGWNRYFEFLVNIVGGAKEYSLLLEDLFNIEFYSLIPNDDDRGKDGDALRDLFLEEVGQTGVSSVLLMASLPNMDCSVLEMLIGLSNRLEFETAMSNWEKTPNEWFWILIDNLGFLEYTNARYMQDQYTSDEVITYVSKMLSRTYNFNGDGGLFPLKNPKKDQRRVEIWYQMSAYILENYYT